MFGAADTVQDLSQKTRSRIIGRHGWSRYDLDRIGSGKRLSGVSVRFRCLIAFV
jgi:hypothetical protein